MNEQMIEAAMKAMREEQRANQNLELGFDDDVYDLAVLTIAAAEPPIRAQVIQEIREAVDHAYMGWSLGRMKQENPPIELIRDALAALEKQP